MYEKLLKYVEDGQLQQDLHLWVTALTRPEQLLSPAFDPSGEQFYAVFVFYLKVAAVSVCVYGLVALFSGSAGVRAKMLAQGVLGLVFFFVFAAIVHLPFSWLGGKASLLGTCTAYMAAGAPFAPLTAVGQWVMVSELPPEYRPYAMNPAIAGQVVQIAMNDPRTAQLPLWTSMLIAWVLMIWSMIATFRSLGFVHDLNGWAFWLATGISFLVAMPIAAIAIRMISTAHEVRTADPQV